MPRLTMNTQILSILLTGLLDPARISLYLPAPHDQVLTDADTWYKLDGAMVDGDAKWFTERGSPNFDVVYGGPVPITVVFIGDADVGLSGTAAEVEFALFHNGVIVNKFTSKTHIAASTDTKSIGTNGTIVLNMFDTLDIRAKCSAAGRTLTVENLKVSWSQQAIDCC
jgi:hypothetical protein